MKSYVLYLQGLYSSIFSEIDVHYPRLYRDSRRDSSRLLSLIETRGLSFLMIDLPEAGKHFDKCLSTGLLTKSGIAGQRPYKTGVVIPRLFKGLLLRVFDDCGVLHVCPDVQAIRFLRQLYYAAKKVRIPCDDSRTWEHVNEFFCTDKVVRSPSLNWDEDELRIDELGDLHFGDSVGHLPAPLFDWGHCDPSLPEDTCSILGSADFETVQRTADIVSSSIGRFDPTEWNMKHGPGAVADQRHTQFKYDFPSWPAKLESVFPMADFGFSNFGNWADFLNSKAVSFLFSRNEPASRLIAVPKTLKGPRLIASEPVSHQWCQQSVLRFLTARAPHTPLSSAVRFNDQTRNQRMAAVASHTQSHATVDLSQASDRLSCWVVERMFRRIPSLVLALHASRTRWVVNTIDRKSPKFHKLRKFACMGSACTFPIQTYCFGIIAVSSVLIARSLRPTIRNIKLVSREVRVFGDDMIVPIDSWVVLQGLLSHFQLKVNQSKTYVNGKFRESCGLDAYDGNDVTPTYSMTYPEVSRPESVISCVATANNFYQRGYFRVAAYIESTVHALKRFSFMRVPPGSGVFGWSDSFASNDHLKKRWNLALQRREYQCDQVSSRSQREPVESDSVLLQYFTEALLPPERSDERLGRALRPAVSIRRRWVMGV